MNISVRPPKGAEFAYEVAQRSIDDQLRRIESLDTKAGILLAAGGVLAGLVYREGSILAEAPVALGFLASMFLLASLLLALVAFFNRKYRSGLSPQAVTDFAARDGTWLKWRFQKNLIDIWRWNDQRLRIKAALISWSLGFLLATTVTTGGYFCILLVGG